MVGVAVTATVTVAGIHLLLPHRLGSALPAVPVPFALLPCYVARPGSVVALVSLVVSWDGFRLL